MVKGASPTPSIRWKDRMGQRRANETGIEVLEKYLITKDNIPNERGGMQSMTKRHG